jgi:hypothetical protein
VGFTTAEGIENSSKALLFGLATANVATHSNKKKVPAF